MGLNVSFTGSSGASNIPTAGEMDSFSSGLKNASSGDLLNALGKPGMEPWQKDAINKELTNRASQSEQAKGGGESEDDIKKLLKKLQDGTISPEELQKLAGILGVDPEKLESVKGKGAGPDGTNVDIQGG